MKIRVIASLLLFSSVAAFAGGKHEHGTGRLDVSIDGGRVTLGLELPLDVLVGFERAPRNDKERAALERANRLLNDGANLFAPSPAAECKLKSGNAVVPFIEAGKTPSASDHADVDADYVFDCEKPSALVGLDTSLFKQLPRLYRLEFQRSGPRGQGGGRMTPKQPVIRW